MRCSSLNLQGFLHELCVPGTPVMLRLLVRALVLEHRLSLKLVDVCLFQIIGHLMRFLTIKVFLLTERLENLAVLFALLEQALIDLIAALYLPFQVFDHLDLLGHFCIHGALFLARFDQALLELDLSIANGWRLLNLSGLL